MNAYSEFIDPTRVSHCVGANVILPHEKHLVVAKLTLLQVFELVKAGDFHKLKLVHQFKLHGKITDIKTIRTLEAPDLDYLVVSTKAAKYSVVKWDHFKHGLSTVSLHYYEQALQTLTYEPVTQSDLLVEPNYACTCLRFKDILVFLPFAVEDEDDEDKKAYAGEDLFDTSFMLEALSLDSSIGNIIDMQFLHNYKEPTIAVISTKSHTWSSKLPQVKDLVNFMVLSLDLTTRQATSVLKIDGLPYDIDTLVPLPLPLNGSLLLGCNEIIHVDNGGITRRIAVNEFTSLITASTKNYTNQLTLNLKLEYCSVKPIPNDNRVLLILNNGEFLYINFEIDSKTIKKVFVEPVPKVQHLESMFSQPGPIATLDDNFLFLANKTGDSPLVKLSYTGQTKKRKRVTFKSDNDDDDDLYGDEDTNEDKILNKGKIEFVVHDQLVNTGPISTFTYGNSSTEKYVANLINPNFQDVAIVSNGGHNATGHLNIMTPSVQAKIQLSLTFSEIKRMWILNNKYLVTSDDATTKSEIFQINKGFARLTAKAFVHDEATIAVHELNNGKFILQVTPKHVTLFTNRFKKVTSLDDELAKDFADDSIINSTLNDEFVMLFFASGEVVIYSINTYSESFSRVSIPKILNDTIITTGCISNSALLNPVSKDVNLVINKGIKRKRTAIPQKTKKHGPKTKTFVLVTGDNRVVAFTRFHNERCYQLNDISKFTEVLNLGFFEPNDTMPDPLIKQVMFCELGDAHTKEEYLTVLTVGGEVIMYKTFFDSENFAFVRVKDLKVTGAPHNAYPEGTSIERRMVCVPDFSGYTAILVTGLTPYIVLKTTHSLPRIFKFARIPIVSFAAYSDEHVLNGVMYIDTKKNARIVELPDDFNYENTWPCKRVTLGETIKAVTYHESSNTYVVSSFKEIKYDCLDEENNPIIGIDPSKPGPVQYKGLIKLISPISWTVIDEIELRDNEVAMDVRSMVLDVGINQKKFKSKKEYIVAGTGRYRFEDLGLNGAFKVIDIIDIIPEPGKPETNHKFKEFTHEDLKGAATSVCEISGRFLVTQGQKIIVRDLQDSGVVPVAFLDTAVYVSEAKSFGNLLLLGDSLKSVWLAGFDAEPFRMIMLGKDLESVDVNCADFIVRDEEIFIVVGDNKGVLHVLHYNPEDPTSSNGQRLLRKASFNLNHSTTAMKTLPKHEIFKPKPEVPVPFFDSGDAVFQTMGATVDGSFYTVFPLGEATYRRLYILQQQLSDKEYHTCGLNPRLNRHGGLTVDPASKPLLDYQVIRNFIYLNHDTLRHYAMKVGTKPSTQHDLWRDFVEAENVLAHM